MTNYLKERAVHGTPAGGLVFTETLDPAAVGAGAVAHEAFVVTGVITGDIVTAIETAETADVAIAHARVSDNDEVTVTFIGGTTGGNPASAPWTFHIQRSAPGPGLS